MTTAVGTVPRLTDGVVSLRRHQESDIPGILAQATDPESIRWTTVPLGYDEAMARRWALEENPAGWVDHSSYGLAIASAQTDEYLGTIDVRPQGTRVAEIGYALAPAARGRGAMTRAISLAADWAFAASAQGGLGLDLLRWMAHVGNYPSRRAAWAAGFTIDATVRGACEQRGVLHDAWVGTLRADDSREPKTAWYECPSLVDEGSGAVLRPVRPKDAQGILEMNTDPLTQHWLALWLPSPYGLEQAQTFTLAGDEDRAAGTAVRWAVSDGPVGTFLGNISLFKIEKGRAEVGYRLHPDGRGRGLATVAVRLAARHAFTPVEQGGLGLRRLELYAASTNAASIAVAERAGFTRWGQMRRDEQLGDGSWDDVVGYDLLAGEL